MSHYDEDDFEDSDEDKRSHNDTQGPKTPLVESLSLPPNVSPMYVPLSQSCSISGVSPNKDARDFSLNFGATGSASSMHNSADQSITLSRDVAPPSGSVEEIIQKVLDGNIWRKQYDTSSGKYYYYHTITKQTTWDLVKELGLIDRPTNVTKMDITSSIIKGEDFSAVNRTSSDQSNVFSNIISPSNLPKEKDEARSSAPFSSSNDDQKSGCDTTNNNNSQVDREAKNSDSLNLDYAFPRSFSTQSSRTDSLGVNIGAITAAVTEGEAKARDSHPQSVIKKQIDETDPSEFFSKKRILSETTRLIDDISRNATTPPPGQLNETEAKDKSVATTKAATSADTDSDFSSLGDVEKIRVEARVKAEAEMKALREAEALSATSPNVFRVSLTTVTPTPQHNDHANFPASMSHDVSVVTPKNFTPAPTNALPAAFGSLSRIQGTTVPTTIISPTLRYPMYSQNQPAHAAAAAAATTSPKTELLQTAEALEKLVKAFVTLRRQDVTTLGRRNRISLNGTNATVPAIDDEDNDNYEVLLRAARYRVRTDSTKDELGVFRVNAPGAVTATSYQPTRDRYLQSITKGTKRIQSGAADIISNAADDALAGQYRMRILERDALAANESLLEQEILDAVIGMMLSDSREGGSRAPCHFGTGNPFGDHKSIGPRDAHAFTDVAAASRYAPVGIGTRMGQALLKGSSGKSADASTAAAATLIGHFSDVVGIDNYRRYASSAATRRIVTAAMFDQRSGAARFGLSVDGEPQVRNNHRNYTTYINAFDGLTTAFGPGASDPMMAGVDGGGGVLSSHLGSGTHSSGSAITAVPDSLTATPLGNMLEESLEKYLLRHVVGNPYTTTKVSDVESNSVFSISPHLARIILLDLLRICLDISLTRFPKNANNPMPLSIRDPIIVTYEGPLPGGKSFSYGGGYGSNTAPLFFGSGVDQQQCQPQQQQPSASCYTQSRNVSLSHATMVVETCKRAIQALPFELLQDTVVPEKGGDSSGEMKRCSVRPPQRPRFRLEHWITRPHLWCMIHALQWTLRKLERIVADPYQLFFDKKRKQTLQENRKILSGDIKDGDDDGDSGRVFATELPLFSLAPAAVVRDQFRQSARLARSVGAAINNKENADKEDEEDESDMTVLSKLLDKENAEKVARRQETQHKYNSGDNVYRLNNHSVGLDQRYFGIEEDHLETMAYAASTISLEVFRNVAQSRTKALSVAANDSKGNREVFAAMTEIKPAPLFSAAEGIAGSLTTAGSQKNNNKGTGNIAEAEPPAIPLTIQQEVATQCVIMCIEELLGDAKILESIKRRATNKVTHILNQRDNQWLERRKIKMEAVKKSGQQVLSRDKKAKEEVVAVEKRIDTMINRIKQEINM